MSRITDYILEQEELGNIEYIEGRGYVDKYQASVDNDEQRDIAVGMMESSKEGMVDDAIQEQEKVK